eukprot:2903773-Ditylum_brightwellii.AAC.1
MEDTTPEERPAKRLHISIGDDEEEAFLPLPPGALDLPAKSAATARAAQLEVPNRQDINTRIQQMQQEQEKAMQALWSELRQEMQQIVNTSIESLSNAIKNDVKDFFKECM